ncbi:helix-turn-helix transcriptional regulator [Kiloniella majae]|uniref:helix-turn-helix transcriptional regulator n=1 Tax=Kiloniella majae TaxID=1938558 RepID=UPI000A278781|nr:helix-turn-helix transcriptional regulator [Kiloniella majae]
MLTLEQVSSCSNLDELSSVFKESNQFFYWQKQTRDFVFTYDKMPFGSLDGYYGSDIDLVCPGAWAYRKRIWPVFSFEQAKKSEEFSYYDPDGISHQYWLSYGIKDCLLILSGTPELNSFAVFGFDEIIEDPVQISLPFILATQKMDIWLEHHDQLKSYSREFSSLSAKEKEAVILQIKKPDLSRREQANILGISENTLKARQERIAKKYGVTSFTSAVVKAVNLREFDYEVCDHPSSRDRLKA